MNEVTLYRKNANSVGSWRIWSEGNLIHIAHATVLDGSEVRHQESVQTNLSGRTIEEQVKLRINSRVSRMRDKGYKDTIEQAIAQPGNQLGLDRPMLAKQITKVPNVNFKGAVLQKKLDGHRCLITFSDGRLIAYSRLGKEIPSIRHILRGLNGRIPEGTTIDGELYCHGVKLQTIGSWIKREQEATNNLWFVAYDLISNDSYKDRHAELSEIVRGCDTGVAGKIVALPYSPYIDSESTAELFRKVRADGFEGLMLRTNNVGYQPGVRSSGLLKIKQFLDQEFEVIGFSQSKTGWAICRCRTDTGREFDCSAPGSHEEKLEVWENQANYRGRYLTIEFAHWTDDGLPFQPTATRWFEQI